MEVIKLKRIEFSQRRIRGFKFSDVLLTKILTLDPETMIKIGTTIPRSAKLIFVDYGGIDRITTFYYEDAKFEEIGEGAIPPEVMLG